MILHVIQSGETVYSIADYYEISVEWLIRDNGIINPNNLVEGAVLVILFPETTHTIREGDTLEEIANLYNVTIMDLLRNNSYLSDQEYLEVGDTIVISYEDEKITNISVIGYCYPYIEETTLRKTLPYLTYIFVYSFVIGPDGVFTHIYDRNVIETSNTYGVAPIMIISFETSSENISEGDLASEILNSERLKNLLLETIINSLLENNYAGISLIPIYIYPDDRQLYVDFLTVLIGRVKELGLLVFDTLIPATFDLISEIFQVQEYVYEVNQLVDSSVLFPVSVGIRLYSPTSIINYSVIEDLLKVYLGLIPPELIQLGINSVGYIWEFPYIQGESSANLISISSALLLAADNDIAISYDEVTGSAYFIYVEGNREFLIRFNDARSIVSYMEIINSYGLNGVASWNIMSFFNNLWQIVNSQYIINKLDL